VIGFIQDGRCDFCDTLFGDTASKGYELHEVAEGEWRVVCTPCAYALELSEGK